MGPGKFLLNCGAGWSSVGLCDGIRIGGDVELNWAGMQTGIDSTLVWGWLNSIAFYTDPDIVCVREPFADGAGATVGHARRPHRQLLMASDKMYDLPTSASSCCGASSRSPTFTRWSFILSTPPTRPPIFDLKVRKPGVGEWDVVRVVQLVRDRDAVGGHLAGAIGRRGGSVGRRRFLDGRPRARGMGTLSVELAPASCRVISVWANEGRPRFVGSSRHLTQGALDVEAIAWDDKKLRLSARRRSSARTRTPCASTCRRAGAWWAASSGNSARSPNSRSRSPRTIASAGAWTSSATRGALGFAFRLL